MTASLAIVDPNRLTALIDRERAGDTGAMAGHSPAPVQAALSRRYADLGGA